MASRQHSGIIRENDGKQPSMDKVKNLTPAEEKGIPHLHSEAIPEAA